MPSGFGRQDGVPSSICGYRRTEENNPADRIYGRRAVYRHPADQDAPTIWIFHNRRSDCYGPAFRIWFFASMRRLLDVREVARFIDEINRLSRVELLLSEIEVCIDFTGGYNEASTINAEVYMPNERSQCRRRGPAEAHHDKNTEDWSTRGSRYSSVHERVYAKYEDSLQCARVEQVIRRGALRAAKINNLADLCAAPLAAMVLKRLKFMTFVPSRDPGDETNWYTPDIARLIGLNGALRQLQSRERARVRRRLQPSPRHALATTLLIDFETQLGWPGRYSLK